MKNKTLYIAVAAVMIVATLFVSCAPSKAVADDTVSVFFGELQAKAVDTNVYNKDADTESDFGASSVDIPAVSDLYWSYKAVKADGNFTAGQTTDMENNVNGYMPVKNEAGLDNTISGLSKGEWNFELQAFASADDRTAGTPVLFYGKTTKAQNLVGDTNTVTIATEWQYPEGKAENVHFEITTDLIQTLTTGITEPYAVSKVTVHYDGQSEAVELKAGNTSDNTPIDNDSTKHKYTTVWTGDMQNTVPNGTRSFTYKFYVDGQEEISTSVTAPVMTNLTTNITGKATVTLTAGSVSVNFSGSTVPTDQPVIKSNTVSKVGDTITNGKANGTDITWKCIQYDATNNRALMISEYVIETRKFDSSSSTYFRSDIQKYLTGTADTDFIKTYSIDTSKMLSVDCTSSIETTTVSDTGTDKLFLLSSTEAFNTSYFADAEARKANDLSGFASSWWLRSNAAGHAYKAEYIESDGTYGAHTVYETDGVRPAFWYTWE